MEAEAAAAGGIGRAEACEGAGNDNRCEKVFHVFSFWAAMRRIDPRTFDWSNICGKYLQGRIAREPSQVT
jgi:hypothetical protein